MGFIRAENNAKIYESLSVWVNIVLSIQEKNADHFYRATFLTFSFFLLGKILTKPKIWLEKNKENFCFYNQLIS